jgi:hypothetical protein
VRPAEAERRREARARAGPGEGGGGVDSAGARRAWARRGAWRRGGGGVRGRLEAEAEGGGGHEACCPRARSGWVMGARRTLVFSFLYSQASLGPNASRLPAGLIPRRPACARPPNSLGASSPHTPPRRPHLPSAPPRAPRTDGQIRAAALSRPRARSRAVPRDARRRRA